MQPCAVVIKPENYQAIMSEAGSTFDRAFLLAWVAEKGPGYFLRDESSPLDCYLIEEHEFLQLYMFARGDMDALFRPVMKL